MFIIIFYTSILLSLSFNSAVSGIPKPDEHRIVDELSHANHFQDETHNLKYDHDAFLGEDQAKTFDQLPPEESRRRLGVIVGKIDENKDGFVNISELKNWIKYTQRRYIEDDVDRQWKQHNPDNKETIQWEVYRKNVYGFMDDMDPADLQNDGDGITYKTMLKRDRRRWTVADSNADDGLSRIEFTDFLHPEESPNMRDLVVLETLEDIDKDGDGKLSADEYIGDMFRGGDDGEEEPEWVTNERETFSKFRDKDQDGFMDNEEVKSWIIPPDFDHAEAEARHLIYEADSDADEKLTHDEILDKYDLFVGSQATDFGEALARHDEF